MYGKSLGIVLRTADYKDYDKMLTVFTRDRGKISCLARGARKQGSPLLASSDVFCCAEYSFYISKDRASINQAQIKNSFYKLRGDFTSLSVASIFADVCEKTAMEGESNPRLFALLASAFFALEEGGDPLGVLIFFSFKALDILGFRPNLSGCVFCGEKPSLRVNIDAGGIVCSEHEGENVSLGTIEAIKNIFTVPSKDMINNLPEKSAELLSLSERWLTRTLDIHPKGYRFVHDLFSF